MWQIHLTWEETFEVHGRKATQISRAHHEGSARPRPGLGISRAFN